MKPSDALAAHRTELRQLASRHGLARPRVFGSVLNGTDTELGIHNSSRRDAHDLVEAFEDVGRERAKASGDPPARRADFLAPLAGRGSG